MNRTGRVLTVSVVMTCLLALNAGLFSSHPGRAAGPRGGATPLSPAPDQLDLGRLMMSAPR